MSRLTAILQGCLALLVFATACSVATAAPWAFIANTNSKSVTIIDTATHSVVKTIALTDTPFEVAVTPTAAYVCGAGSKLDVISLPSLTLAATAVSLPRVFCESIIANKAGTTLYVTFNSFSGNNSIVAVNTSTLQSTVLELPKTPTKASVVRVALSPDESLLYATYFGNVSVVKTTPTLSLLRSISLGATVATNNIELNKAGTTAYVPAYQTKQVFAVNLSNDTSVPINLLNDVQSVALAPDGRYAWVPNTGYFSSRPIASIIDTVNNSVSGSVAVPISINNTPWAVDFTPDGTFAYIINNRSSVEPGTISVIRVATGQLQTTITVGTNPWNRARFIGPLSAPAANVTVPNVVGQSQSAASSTITAAGLTVGTITQQASSTIPAGNVISQNPATGASVAAGSAVSLVVSTGSSTGGTSGPYAFVPNFNSNTLTIIDTATNALVKTVSAGTQPTSVAITPGAVYMCAYGSTSMAVLMLPDLSAGTDIPVPGGCQCIAANKAGTTVYASGGPDGFVVLNTATRQYTTLPMPGSIANLLLSPDESTLYATHASSGKISVMRTSPSVAITRTIAVAGQPYGMDINKSGTTLYVAMYDKAAVYVYDLGKDTFVSVPVGQVPVQVTLTPDGKFLYVANSGSDTVSIINTQNNTVSASFSSGKQPYGIDFNTDGSLAYVVNQDPSSATGNVSIYRTASGQLEKTIATAKLPTVVGRFIGPRNDSIVVPNVVGMTEPAASAAIFAANLTLGSISTANSNTVASGNVISQSPSANASVAPRTPVSLVISIGPPIVVVEFYHAPLDHYFVTADPNEQRAIDSGSAGPGWSRTGDTFLSDGTTTVCRFYGNANTNPATGTIYGPNSHFYTVAGAECNSLIQIYNPNAKSWHFESQDFRTSPLVNGGCTASQVPIYRAYNNGFTRGIDSNHRLTPNQSSIQQVVARGWISEGVVMCAPK